MTWQIAITLQIIAGSIVILFVRQISLSTTKLIFGIAAFSYLTIAVCGWVFGELLKTSGLTLPSPQVWPYLVIEGLFIPSSWLIQYRLIKYLGASNTAIVTILNILVTAILGIILLNDSVTLGFFFGSILVLIGIGIALRLQPDIVHKTHASLTKKALLTIIGALLYGFGLFAEKKAINSIGVWDYAKLGWSMQAAGAISLFVLFGRKELAYLKSKIIYKSVLLGLLTSISGVLYIYAVSKGSLSHTVIATSGKVAIVMLLAAIFLKERNSLKQRLTAFVSTMVGLFVILL